MKIILNIFTMLDIDKKQFLKRHLLYFQMALVYSLSAIIYPSFIHIIIDKGINTSFKLTMFYCLQMVFVGVIMVVSDYLSRLLYSKFNINFTIELKQNLFIKILDSDNSFASSKKVGDIYTSLNSDVNAISALLIDHIPGIIKNVLTLVGVSYYIVAYFGLFGGIILLIASISVLFQDKIGNRIMNISEKLRMAIGDESSFTNEVLAYLEEIQMAGENNVVLSKFAEKNQIVKSLAVNNEKLMLRSYSLGYILNTFIMLIILTFGAINVQLGVLQVGMLFSLTIYAQRLINPLGSLISAYIDIKNTYPLIKRMDTLLSKISKNKKGMIVPINSLQQIDIQNGDFKYNNTETKKILENFNLSISNGEILGIVGSNGTGKSTLLKLIMKCCNLDKGSMMVNQSYKLDDVDDDYLHSHISYVGQNPFLFSGTLRDAINPLGRDITEHEVIAVFQGLNLDYQIFGNSLDYNLSEGTNNLSGGEKQKIALAKALLENKEWFVLDEPTSAMDSESEKIICQYLKRRFTDKTAIIITHRPEILNICSRIVDFDGI